MASIFWFRFDLRTEDHPALNAAIMEAKKTDGRVFSVVSPNDYRRLDELSPTRQESMWESWRSLNSSINDGLTVVDDPVDSIIRIAQENQIDRVFVSAAYDTNTVAFMRSSRAKLEAAGLELVVGPGNYAVAPGRVRKLDGTPFRVYTPFYRAWSEIGWEKPHVLESGARWVRHERHIGLDSPTYSDVFAGVQLESRKIKAGEQYATSTFARFKARGALDAYDEMRNRADVSGTSHLSHALAHGEIHPRTLLAELGDSAGEVVFAKELAWREFYADVLWHNPASLTEYLDSRYANMRYDDGTELGEQRLRAWMLGRTGYPMVDAGMRQLLSEGWMHNRVRMVVASFLIKDLHIEWQRGAEWFETWLTDFDPASNAHGWQWTAGCGTDAAPFYRVFNPVLQGLKFDPDGDYVRRYVPELAHLPGGTVHEPWKAAGGYAHGYPERVVDHHEERDAALADFAAIKGTA
ncbi:MAG: cryptochrome/photolyase family protein [Microbacteriaceae bacterium]